MKIQNKLSTIFFLILYAVDIPHKYRFPWVYAKRNRTILFEWISTLRFSRWSLNFFTPNHSNFNTPKKCFYNVTVDYSYVNANFSQRDRRLLQPRIMLLAQKKDPCKVTVSLCKGLSSKWYKTTLNHSFFLTDLICI